MCLSILISLYILSLHNRYDLGELRIDYLFKQDFWLNGLFKPLLILFVIQFVPIVMLVQNLLEYHLDYEFNIILLRDYLLAPLTEEINYRFILLKLLCPCFSKLNSCLISSFLFGFSHFHHYVLDTSKERTLFSTCCQFTFTFLFGMFASSMYLKSGYIITPIVLHAICNFLCLPDFETIIQNRTLSIATVCTVALGLYLMYI